MSGGMIFSAVIGVLAPLSLIAACVFEAMAFKMAKNPRCDQKLLAKRRPRAAGEMRRAFAGAGGRPAVCRDRRNRRTVVCPGK